MPGGSSTLQLDRPENAKPRRYLILSETLTLSSSPLQVATAALPPCWGTAPLRSPKNRSSPGVFAGSFSRLLPSPFLSVWGRGGGGAGTVLPNLVFIPFLHPRPPGPLPREPLAIEEKLEPEHLSLRWVFPGSRLQVFRSAGSEHPVFGRKSKARPLRIQE